jgi:DNA-binding transcriptional LysR family regulator
MPALDWDDLRIVLALSRGGSLAAAARLVHVDETTVARRLAAAEAAVGAQLFERIGGRALRPTAIGEAAVAAAERVEQSVGALHDRATRAHSVAAGTVRLTAVPLLVNHLLVPALPDLAARCPGVTLELLAEPRDLSLSRREADLALRMARPAAGAGAGILARRMGLLRYAAYAPAGLDEAALRTLPWIGYEPGMAELPPARWLADRLGGHASPVALNDAEALLRAVASGLGRTVLPCAVADRLPGIARCDPPGLPPPPARELWLLAHPDQRGLARTAAVQGWLERTLVAAGIGN